MKVLSADYPSLLRIRCDIKGLFMGLKIGVKEVKRRNGSSSYALTADLYDLQSTQTLSLPPTLKILWIECKKYFCQMHFRHISLL